MYSPYSIIATKKNDSLSSSNFAIVFSVFHCIPFFSATATRLPGTSSSVLQEQQKTIAVGLEKTVSLLKVLSTYDIRIFLIPGYKGA